MPQPGDGIRQKSLDPIVELQYMRVRTSQLASASSRIGCLLDGYPRNDGWTV